MAGNVAVGGVADDATVGDALEEPATRTATAAAPAQRASGRRRAESGGDIARAAPAVPPELQAARAARSRGDHRSAVGAYTRYFERHRGHNEFSRSLFEAAASYEALGDVGKALRMYGLIPASAGSWYTRAQARIGALRAVRNTPPPSNAGANADDGDDESNQVRPMPMPPEVDPPRR